MRIAYDQTYEAPLANFGSELVRMIKDGRLRRRLTYALAFGRPLADAVASDIELCLMGDGRSAVINLVYEARILVKYFKQPNSSNLFGLVECFLPLDQDSGELLAELIVTTKENKFYVGLEGVSYAA
jgi:hypothetical protein